MRALAAAGLLVGGLAWSVQLQFGVTEIRRSDSARSFPLAMAPVSTDDWPGLRGPRQTGECPHEGFPRTIGSAGRLTWQADVPGLPYGGPCVRGELVVIPVVDADSGSIALWAFDREAGQSAWKTVVHRDVRLNPALIKGLATPACDGQAVFLGTAVDGRLQVSSVDLQGRVRWITDAGPMRCENGRLVSPLLHDELAIVSADHRGSRTTNWIASSHLTAVHRQTGEIIWRIRRPNGDHQATPALADIGGRTQLILAGPGEVCAYDPANGKSLWSCRWEAARVADSVAWDDRHIYVAAREPRPLVMAIRVEHAGDASQAQVVWQSQAAAVSSLAPVRWAESVVLLSDDGLLTSLDCATGRLQWKRQLAGTFTAAPLRAGSELLCLNSEGTAFVVDLAQRGKTVAEPAVGDGVVAHPAATRRQWILRTRTGLIGIPWNSPESPVVHTPDKPAKRL